MTPELTDVIIEFMPTVTVSFVLPLAAFGIAVTTYHLAQKYELPNKSKILYSQTKDNLTELLDKYHH